MIVYKVVMNHGGVMKSHATVPGYTLKYEMNEVTVPNVGLLYAFRTLTDARRFVRTYGCSHSVILESEAVVTRHRNHRICFSDAKHYRKFWTNQKFYMKSNVTSESMEGTIFCRSIKPLREIT